MAAAVLKGSGKSTRRLQLADTMLRAAILAWLCLQQMPRVHADEVVLVSQALPAAVVPNDVQNLAEALSPEALAAAAALAGVNITIINGTAYEEYEVPDNGPLSSGNDSLPARAPEPIPADANPTQMLKQPANVPSDSAAAKLDAIAPKLMAEPRKSAAAATTSTRKVQTTTTTPTTTVSTTITTASGPATVQVELGRLSVYPLPAVIENSGAMELFCSAGYHDSASIVWTLNDEPIEDVVQRSVISGRKDFFLKSLRIQVDRLEALPAPAGKYIFECVASVDGNLLKERVELDSPYGNFCRNDSECSARNAVCGSSLSCRCDGGHPVSLNSSHVTCRAAAHLGWPCSYDEQCLFASNNSHCGSKGECDCIETFKMETSPLGNVVCVPKKTVSGACTVDADCKDIGAMCGPSQTCQCPKGTLENNGRCVGQLVSPSSSNSSLSAAVPEGPANGSAVGAGSIFPTNASTGSTEQKFMPLRILKVREFPRGAPVKEKPNDTADGHTHNLEGLVKVDAPPHENDTTLGSQRMLTGSGHRILGSYTAVSSLIYALACFAMIEPVL